MLTYMYVCIYMCVCVCVCITLLYVVYVHCPSVHYSSVHIYIYMCIYIYTLQCVKIDSWREVTVQRRVPSLALCDDLER